jgi:hypothetical protein
MAQASCHGCGADIVWRDLPDGSKGAFDVHEVSAGPGRYVDSEEGLRPVTETASVSALQLHALVCPVNDR